MHATPRPEPVTGTVVQGLLALAVAMGIGRFAFTPLLPLMLRDGELTALSAAEWAMANYIGYLAGALTAARVASRPWRASVIGLIGVALCTLLIGWPGLSSWGIAGPLLRGAAGVFSAWVLVGASSACLIALARAQRITLSGWIYTGVGLGIAAAGALAWLGGAQPARWIWLEFGALAALGAWAVSRIGSPHDSPPPSGSPPNDSSAPASQPISTKAEAVGSDLGLVICYGVFGYGYIVLATFLPAMAREQVADPLVFGLTWPVFGLAAALSVGLATRWCSGIGRERLWAWAQTAMAIGTALPLFSLSLAALTASAVLVGGTFMVATMAGLQLARQRHPDNPTPLVARMTIAFALGQIAGPALVRVLGKHPLPGLDALAWANLLATAMLGLSAAWLWRRAHRLATVGSGPALAGGSAR